MNRLLPQNLANGQAAVYRVAAELLLRGMGTYFPSVDIGADLIIEPSIRVQVKASTLRRTQNRVYPQGAYWFKFVQGPIVTGNHTIRKRGPRKFSDEVDFIILHGIDQNRYWIVPAAILDGKSLTVVGPDAANCPNAKSGGRYGVSRQVRECEGRWDYIAAVLSTLKEANKVVETRVETETVHS